MGTQRIYDNTDDPSTDAGYGLEHTSDGGFLIGGEATVAGFPLNVPYMMKLDMNGDPDWTKMVDDPTHAFSGRINDVIQLGSGGYVGVGKQTTTDDYWMMLLDTDGTAAFECTSSGVPFYATSSGFALTGLALGNESPGSDPILPVAGVAVGHHSALPGNFQITTHVFRSYSNNQLFGSAKVIDDLAQIRQDQAYAISRAGTDRMIISGSSWYTSTLQDKNATLIHLELTSLNGLNLLFGSQYGVNTGEELFYDVTPTHDALGVVDGAVAVGSTNSYSANRDLFVIKVDLSGAIVWSLIVDEGGDESGSSVLVHDDGSVLVVGSHRLQSGAITEGYVFRVEMDPATGRPDPGTMSSYMIQDAMGSNNYTSLSDAHLFNGQHFTTVGSTLEFGAEFYDIFFSTRPFTDRTCNEKVGHPVMVDHNPSELGPHPLDLEMNTIERMEEDIPPVKELPMTTKEICAPYCQESDASTQSSFQWSYGGHHDRGYTGFEHDNAYLVAGSTDQTRVQRVLDGLLVLTDPDGNSDLASFPHERFRKKIRTGTYIGETFVANEWDEIVFGSDRIPLDAYSHYGYGILAGVDVRRADDQAPNQKRGDTNALLIKVDYSGEVLWARDFGKNIATGDYSRTGTGFSADVLKATHSLDWDNDGRNDGYIVAGYSNSNLNSAALDQNVRSHDMLILRTDNDGFVGGPDTWMKTFSIDNDDDEYAYDVEPIDMDSDGFQDDGFVVVGTHYEYQYDANVIVMILDEDGNIVNQAIYSRESNGQSVGVEQGLSIEQTDDDGDGLEDDGFIIVGGARLYDEINDVLVLKLNHNLQKQWNRVIRLGDSKANVPDYATSVDQTLDGGYIVTGTTSATGEPYVNNPEQGFLLKLNEAGFPQWGRELPTDLANDDHEADDQEDHGNYVQQTTDGGYMVAGSTCSFSAMPNLYGKGDAWLVKTRCDGEVCKSNVIGELTVLDYDLQDFFGDFVVEEGATVLSAYFPQAIDALEVDYDCTGDVPLCQYEACTGIGESIGIPVREGHPATGGLPSLSHNQLPDEPVFEGAGESRSAAVKGQDVAKDDLQVRLQRDVIGDGDDLLLTLLSRENGVAELTITTTLGEPIYQRSVGLGRSISMAVAVKDWPSGMYFLTVRTPTNVVNRKLRIE